MANKTKDELQELSIEEKLQHLYELQRIDTEIDKIKTLRGELPLEVQDLEDEIAGLNTRLQNLKVDISEAEKSVSVKKDEIVKSEELIKKYSDQLTNVRNNREYDALTKEVEFQKLEIELLNKKIREAQKHKTEKENLLEVSQQLYNEKQKDLEAKKSELDDIIAETHKDEENFIKQSEVLAGNIEERLLSAYKRIRANARNGLAVATVDRDACGGCFNKIPPQKQLDIRSRKKIIVCEYCGRILIDKYICDYDGSMQKADELQNLENSKKNQEELKEQKNNYNKILRKGKVMQDEQSHFHYRAVFCII